MERKKSAPKKSTPEKVTKNNDINTETKELIVKYKSCFVKCQSARSRRK